MHSPDQLRNDEAFTVCCIDVELIDTVTSRHALDDPIGRVSLPDTSTIGANTHQPGQSRNEVTDSSCGGGGVTV